MVADENGTFSLGNVRISVGSFAEALQRLLAAPAGQQRLQVHFGTAHTIVEAADSPELRAALNAPAAVLYPDGMPLVWMGRLQGRHVQRVCGPDMMPALLDRGRARDYRHFFYGGAEGVAERLVVRVQRRFPGLHVAGVYTPPFRPLSAAEDEAVIATINAAAPDYLWVGLGTPKQDLWLYEHRSRLNAPVLLAVGAAFDFHSGGRRRSPRWMQRAGVEWLYRLGTEPRRLWRRYSVTNLRFLGLAARDLLGTPLRGISERRNRGAA